MSGGADGGRRAVVLRARRRIAIASALIVSGAGFAAIGTASPAGAATVPGKPGAPVANAINGGATLQWSAPASLGSPPLTGYRVEKNSGSGWVAAALEARVDAIAAGNEHTCALLHGGKVKCWGANSLGQLGLGDTVNRGDGPGEMADSLPAVALGTGRNAIAITAGSYHTCALLDNGTVKCWGRNFYGNLGLGDTVYRGDDPNEMGDSLPAVALGTGRTAIAISAGDDDTCALLDNGTVKCWGRNIYGVLGLGSTANRGDNANEMGNNLPAVSLGTGRTVVEVKASAGSSCARLDNGTVKCWGYNGHGELGLGDTANRGDGPGEMGDNLPAVALGTGRTAVGIGGADRAACAVLDNGTVKCWGFGYYGSLGLGDMQTRGDAPGEMGDALPAVSLGTGRSALSVTSGGGDHVCALLTGGTVKCWGLNRHGQLGLGDVATRGDGAGEMGDNLPTVSLGRTVLAISAGYQHTCALLDNATVKCFGYDFTGQLGLGDTRARGDAREMGNSLVAVAVGTVGVVSVRSATVRLARGTYQFRIVALNSAGASAPSDASPALAVSAVPGRPTNLTASPGDHRVSLTWVAPSSDGGSPITSYQATILNNDGEVAAVATTTRIVGPAARSLTWTGLYNGAGYKFRVAAINAVGTGPPVQLPNQVIPAALPGVPRSAHVNAGSDRITVLWSRPDQDGGSKVTSYQVRVFNGSGGPATGVTGPTTRSLAVGGAGIPPYNFSFEFDGLTLGTAYTFTIAAVTSVGTGPVTPLTPPIVVGSPAAPSVKTVSGSAGPQTGSLIVTVDPGGDNGSPITGYTVTCRPQDGGASSTQTGDPPMTITGLTTGEAYGCSATATNVRGTGGPSAESWATVGAPGAPTGVHASATGVRGELAVSFVAPDDNGSPITVYTVSCNSDTGVPGYVEGAASPITMTGLSPGNWYMCTVGAVNARGYGPPSEPTIWTLT